ncbi:MAG: hypothetical protein IPP47_02785 [Bryobacterales bacterium]|nr:hypothetical protein [Bryobacterales bacterium]
MALRYILLLMATLSTAGAQFLVDESTLQGKTLLASFDTIRLDRSATRLACAIQRYPPVIDYALRVWSGFNVTVPARQLLMAQGEQGAVAFRVTPKQAPQARKYFWQRFTVPPMKPGGPPPEKLELTVGGGFLLGRGDYQVELVLMDSRGQRCTKSWSIGNGIKEPGVLTKPNTVEPNDTESWPGFAPDGAGRVTIFIHAAPVWPRRNIAKLSSWDRRTLMSSLNSLLRNTRYASACVVVFDLERRRILFRDPEFGRMSLRRLARQLADVDLSTIPMATIQAGPSPDAFVQEMLRTEVKETARSDSFVFLGTTWRAGPKLQPLPADLRESMAKTWFFAFRYPAVTEEDTVSSLVKQVRGKTFSLYRPPDLAAAIRNMTSSK